MRYKPFAFGISHPEKEWPDLLSFPNSMHTIVSEKVLNDMREAGVVDFKIHAITFEKLPKKYRGKGQYWVAASFGERRYSIFI